MGDIPANKTPIMNKSSLNPLASRTEGSLSEGQTLDISGKRDTFFKNPGFRIFFAATAVIFNVIACKKSDTPAPQQNNNADGQTMAAFMKDHGPQFENFTVDAGAGATITSSK